MRAKDEHVLFTCMLESMQEILPGDSSEGASMEISMLKEYICFAKYMNVTKAAKHLHMAPSSLSRHIAFMEKELGAELIAKTDQRLIMTAAGSMLLNSACSIVAEYDDLTGKISAMNNAHVADIFIDYALDDRAIIENISLAYRSLSADIKGAAVRTNSVVDHNMIRALDEGTVDIAIFYDVSELDTDKYHIAPLFEDEIEVVLPLSIAPDDLPRSPADLTDFFIPWLTASKDNYLNRVLSLFDACEHKPAVRWIDAASMDEFFMRPLQNNEMWLASKRQFTTYASSVPLCFRTTTNLHELVDCDTKLIRYAVYPKNYANPVTPEFVKAMQTAATELPG